MGDGLKRAIAATKATGIVEANERLARAERALEAIARALWIDDDFPVSTQTRVESALIDGGFTAEWLQKRYLATH